jgi:hypothetical protein
MRFTDGHLSSLRKYNRTRILLVRVACFRRRANYVLSQTLRMNRSSSAWRHAEKEIQLASRPAYGLILGQLLQQAQEWILLLARAGARAAVVAALARARCRHRTRFQAFVAVPGRRTGEGVGRYASEHGVVAVLSTRTRCARWRRHLCEVELWTEGRVGKGRYLGC